MPLVFLVCGVAFLVSALQNTQPLLLAQIEKDFTQKPSFVVWVLALVCVGSIGYVPALKPISNGLLVLLFIGLVLSNNKGLIAKLGS